MSQETIDKIKETVIDYLIKVGPNILLALVLLIAGFFLIKFLTKLIRKGLRKREFDPSLTGFTISLSRFFLYIILIVIVGSTLGIETSSFVAILGAAGLAIGLALQGSLANFAGGMLILVFKPFKVNDLIYINNNLGRVTDIDILYTRMLTFDYRVITMPNGNLSNNNVENHTMMEQRRIDMKIKLSFTTDIKKVRSIVISTLKKHPKVFDDPAPDFWLDEIGEYDLKISTRCWVEPEEYWPVYWEQLEAIKEALEAEGISIPIPRSEIYLPKEGDNFLKSREE